MIDLSTCASNKRLCGTATSSKRVVAIVVVIATATYGALSVYAVSASLTPNGTCSPE
jgi:hypothetical protein